MRYRLAAALVLLFPMLVVAQAPPTLDKDKIRIGLPSAGRTTEASGRSRSGAWAPVAVVVKSSPAGHAQGMYRLRIETTDLEEQVYQYTVPVPAMSANGERTVQGYIVPGSDTAVFSVKLETVEGRVVDVRDKLTRDGSRGELVGDLDILFLAAGAGLSSLKQATLKLEEQEDGKKDKGKEDNPFKGKRQFVFAEDVVALPDRWYGYDAVDVVVLATGKVEFVNLLTQDNERRNALLEWVRRGGQLVLSVGRNKQEVAQLLARMPLLDVKITGSQVAAELPVLSQRFCNLIDRRDVLRKVEAATLVPGPNTHVIVREAFGPVLMEGSCGLGRVVLVGFDLDAGEFSTWKGQDAFWSKVQDEVAPYLPRGRPGRGGKGKQPDMPGNPDWQGEDAVDPSGSPLLMKAVIKRVLEQFAEVPTIPFGYVLVFLLLYIALVGPLDYFLLKKVFKRLELTWITFPIIVAVVSVAAYFTAYSLKGDDLRVNKIDLLDIDLHEPKQVYGHAWLTLFSPRAESYTLGIEPPVGAWTEEIPEGVPGPVVTLLEGGDNTRRQATQSLFARPYEYADDASGLQYVSVPVWSTRSFTANWRAPVRKKPPIGVNDVPEDKDDKKLPVGGDEPGVLRLGEGDVVSGRLKNNLKVPLKDVCLFFHEKWYKLGDLAPGEERRTEQVFAQGALGLGDFFSQSVLTSGIPVAPSGRPVGAGFENLRGSHDYLKRMMFFRASPWSANNSGLRTLDQTWRLKPLPQFPDAVRTPYRNEVILVTRAPLLCDHAEQVIDHDASGSRLWLRDLPGPGKERPTVRGLITQETYVRVFIPVKRRP